LEEESLVKKLQHKVSHSCMIKHIHRSQLFNSKGSKVKDTNYFKMNAFSDRTFIIWLV